MNQTPERIRPLRLVVIEPHRRVRQALADRLGASPLIEIAATLGHLPADPDIIFEWNVQMILLGKSRRAVYPSRRLESSINKWTIRNIRVVVLTPYDHGGEHEALIKAGVSRILLKQINTPELIDELMEIAYQQIG